MTLGALSTETALISYPGLSNAPSFSVRSCLSAFILIILLAGTPGVRISTSLQQKRAKHFWFCGKPWQLHTQLTKHLADGGSVCCELKRM